MIFQNFGFNQNYPVAAGPSGPTYPDQSLATWTATESAAWLAAGATQTTASFGYSSTSTRIGSSYAGSAKWYGAALASNGKVYCPPYDSRTDWAIINTSADTVAVTGSINKYNFGARYDKITNQVFAMGGGGTKINCSTDVASNISGPSSYNGGAVQVFDGNILVTAPLYNNNFIYTYNISTNNSLYILIIP